MRFAVVAALTASLSVPAQAASWTVELSGVATGVYQKVAPNCANPMTPPSCGTTNTTGPAAFSFSMIYTFDPATLPAVFNFSFFTGGPWQEIYGPDWSMEQGSMSGRIENTPDGLIGRNFALNIGNRAVGCDSRCTIATAQLTAPDFMVRFIRSSDGSAPVPEPATWALMILGFGMVGASMRRRKSADRIRQTYA